MLNDYTSHLSLDAARVVSSQPKRQQRNMLDIADQIAKYPFRQGDYQTLDENNRSIDHFLIEKYVYTYWVDHSAKEVRILEIAIV
jgi:hypothetical protein